jgi:hypothetical protein
MDSDRRWSVVAVLNFQGLTVRQILACKLRLNDKKGKCLALLHEKGCVSFWSAKDWHLVGEFSMHTDVSKIIFEASFRYLAALKTNGSVSVWKMKGTDPSHQWDLDFKSVADIVANSAVENQFFLLMAADDHPTSDKTSVLLFQFSRPQNLVMYWKFKTPIRKITFASGTSCLYIFNRNGEH